VSEGRVALVTGANRGIGREVARQLLARGLRVVLAGRDLRAVEGARRAIGGEPANAMAVRLDVTDPASIGDAAATVAKPWGGVDVLVNNAAVLLDEDSDVLTIPGDHFRETLETNLLGVIETCRVFVPPMAERGYGRVVNVSSSAGQISTMSTYAPAYSISKAALNAFTRVLAATYRGRGVLANAVDPGWVRTDMGGPRAPRSVEEGADGIVWCATLPAHGPSGGYFLDRRPIDW
jgi:NAD(P)-dependent dehydrogenase (short-subunit alcohol dehydrogenase family)